MQLYIALYVVHCNCILILPELATSCNISGKCCSLQKTGWAWPSSQQNFYRMLHLCRLAVTLALHFKSSKAKGEIVEPITDKTSLRPSQLYHQFHQSTNLAFDGAISTFEDLWLRHIQWILSTNCSKRIQLYSAIKQPWRCGLHSITATVINAILHLTEETYWWITQSQKIEERKWVFRIREPVNYLHCIQCN